MTDTVSLRTDAVFEEYHPKILQYMRSKLGFTADAEDLASEVFEKIVAKKDTYDPSKSALSTWIYTISRNVLIDYYRRNKADDVSFDDGIEVAAPDCSDMDDMLDRLYDALNRLSEVQRDVVVLHYFKKLPHREIAVKMGLSYPNTQKICSTAVKRLRELLKN